MGYNLGQDESKEKAAYSYLRQSGSTDPLSSVVRKVEGSHC